MLQQIRNNYNVNSFCDGCMHLVVAKKVSTIRREEYSRMDIRKQSKIIKEKRKYCKKNLTNRNIEQHRKVQREWFCENTRECAYKNGKHRNDSPILPNSYLFKE